MPLKIDFIEGKTRSCLFTMALPMMAAMLLNMAYNLVDSLWIGNLLGKTAYAALTNATPIILMLNAIAMGATNGVSILLSQSVGAKQQEKTDRMIATSLAVAVLFSLSVTAIAELLLKPVLSMMQTPPELFSMTYEYLAIYLMGYVTVFLYCYFTAVLRSFGNTMFQMVAMLVCTGLNAVLDPIFIHFAGLKGAAAATLISQTICLIFMILYLAKKKLFAIRRSSLDRKAVLPFFQKGIPSAFQQSIPAISTGFLTSFVSGFGITALAAYGITGKLETILFYPAMALNMVLTTIVGQCAGGGRFDRARDYIKAALFYGTLLLAVISAIVVLFSRQLSGLFFESPKTAEVVARYFSIVGIGYVLNTITNCFLGVVNGMGKPMKSMLCMVLYYLVIRIPSAWLFSHIGFGLDGIWSAVLVSHIIAALAAAIIAEHQLQWLERSNSHL